MESRVPLAASEDLDLSGDFVEAFRLIADSHDGYFVTGKAGTGKSTLLRYYADQTSGRVALLAPTGIAAVNIQGETIHSFFRYPAEPITSHHIYESRIQELYRSLDTIVIDEVSTVRADLMDGVDQMLRLNRARQSVPFGGAQMLFFGDVFQLQPVVASEQEAKFFSSYYRSPYFFDAKAFEQADFRIIDLRKVFRQRDEEFIKLLDSVRMNQTDERQLRLLNSRYSPGFTPDDRSSHVTLASTNRIAAEVNESRLQRIDEPEFKFLGILEGEFPRTSLPTEMVLRMKRGSQVMFVKNAIDRRWVNGTIGKVVELSNDHIRVEVNEEGRRYLHDVRQATWEVRKHTLGASLGSITTEVVGTFTQYPLKLAWAITIHKSQGLTFDKVVIDLGRGAFAHGQTYVALSRCTSFEGLILKTQIRRRDMIVDQAVKRFYTERIRRAT